MASATYTKAGTKATTPVKLNKDIFGVSDVNHELIKAAYLAYLGGGRQNLARTKTRGLVRGGGKKPWRQKGTGRARFGSTRNPLWRGGGIVFGPTGSENYTLNVNVKAKREAIRQSLSLAEKAAKVILIEDIAPKDGKTKELVKLLSKIGADKKTLIVTSEFSEELTRAAANLQNVVLVSAKFLSVFQILNADHIVFSKNALSVIDSWLAKNQRKPA